MDEATFKKDKTPYLIFECVKCKQFMYVKTTQKGKKCLRCGRMHTVSKILGSGEIVNGMTTAVEEVKRKQRELGKNELGHDPEFRAFGDFKVAGSPSYNEEAEKCETNKEQDKEFSGHFEIILKEISSTYKTFPSYVLEVMVDNYMIPQSQLKSLIKQFLKKGILKKLEGISYSI